MSVTIYRLCVDGDMENKLRGYVKNDIALICAKFGANLIL